MKKITVLFLTVMTMTLFSCSKDESSKVASVAKVKVTQNGQAKAGVTVCLFSSEHGPGTGFFNPFYADKKVITESNGIALFELQKVFDLDAIDTQTTLYFGVFDSKERVLGQTAMTIKKGETKMSEITIK